MCFHLAQTTMTHGCERPRSSGGTNLLPAPAPALPRPSDPGDRSALACARLSSAPGPGPGPCSTHRGPGAVPPTLQTAGPRSTPSPPAPAWLLSPRAGRTPPRAAGPQGLGGCRAIQHKLDQAVGSLHPQPHRALRARPCCHSLCEAGALEPHRQLSSHCASSRSTIHLPQVPRGLGPGLAAHVSADPSHPTAPEAPTPPSAAGSGGDPALRREAALGVGCVAAVPTIPCARGARFGHAGVCTALPGAELGPAGWVRGGRQRPSTSGSQGRDELGGFGDVLQAGGLWATGKGLEGCGHLGAMWDPR